METPMKDKETKEKFYRLFKMALNQAVSGEEMRDGEKDGLEELINYVSKLEQEAERRGYQRHREEVVDRIKCLPSKKKCRPTVKNGRRNWLPVRYSPREILLKLLEEENEKQNAR